MGASVGIYPLLKREGGALAALRYQPFDFNSTRGLSAKVLEDGWRPSARNHPLGPLIRNR
jgi:hypothetical protein